MQITTDWHNRMLGRYHMKRMLGRGGMGEVWLAEDTQLNRPVAIKLLHAVLASNQHYLDSFVYEARAAAALDHPHILPIHDFSQQQIDQDTVIPYLVMPYMTGGSLRDRIRQSRGPLPPDEALHYLRQVANAIDYAHSKNVLHRDIKPGNMLLKDRWLFLNDFGIAKLLEDKSTQRLTHAGSGTPEYMAPEQAQRRGEPASDRYSLAIVAYQLFTGRVPYTGKTPYEVIMRHFNGPLTPPRQINLNIPVEVERILLLALSVNPEQRPPSCIALIDAIERHWKTDLQAIDREITLVRPSLIEYANTDSDITPVTPQTQSDIIPSQIDPDSLNKDIQEKSTQIQPLINPPSKGLSRRAMLTSGLIFTGTGIAAAIGTGIWWWTSQKPPTTQKSIQIPKGKPLIAFIGHTDDAYAIRWDPSGRYIISGGYDTRVMLWDVQEALKQANGKFQTIDKPLHQWKFTSGIFSDGLDWSKDGKHVFVSPLSTEKIYVLDITKMEEKPLEYTDTTWDDFYGFNKQSYSNVAYAPTGKRFATANHNRVTVWQEGKTTAPIQTFQLNSLDISTRYPNLTWSPDGILLASNTNKASVAVWNTETNKRQILLELPPRTDKQIQLIFRDACQWSPIDNNILVVSDIDIATIWDVRQKKLLLSLGIDDPLALTPPEDNPTGWVPHTNGLCWSPDGKYIAGSYGRSSSIYLWETQQESKSRVKDDIRMPIETIGQQEGHSNTIVDLAWSPDGRYLASCGMDRSIVIWKMYEEA